MGRASRFAMAGAVVAAQLQVIRAEMSRRGKKEGTDQAAHLVERGLEKLTSDRIVANLRVRQRIMAECKGSKERQDEEYAKCRSSFIYWLEHYGWTYDPRLKQRTVPFVPYEYQREMAEWLQKIDEAKGEGLIEKSRDMGATWMVVAWFTWSWIFEEEFTGLFCSRKVTLVDSKGDPSSIMHKARIMIRALPTWMMPVGYDESKHALKLRILNPANGSVLVGEGGNQIGRGGRASRVLVDEAAFTANPDNVEASLSETADVKFWLSTPNAPGDWFHTKRESGNVPVLSQHWKRHPEKNKWVALDAQGTIIKTGQGEAPAPESLGARRVIYPWYERTKAKFSDMAKMAREVDIDYSASSDRLVFPSLWVRAAVQLDLGDFDDSIPECGGDMAGAGADSDIWTMRRGPIIALQKVIERPNPTQVARAFLMLTQSVGASILHYDTGGGYGGAMAGEHDPVTNGGKNWGFKLHGITGGNKCSKRKFGDTPARDLFLNLKAEMFYTVRERFRKSYELWLWRQGDPAGIPHNPEDCISIPNDADLIKQLTSILFIEGSSGRIQIESKESMRDRGVKSPDKAESMIYTFAPTPNPAANEPARSTTMSG